MVRLDGKDERTAFILFGSVLMNRGIKMANDIFVALRPFSDDSKNGLPADINMVYSELFDSKNPMVPTYSTDWLSYRPKRDGIPVPGSKKLPEKLFLICKICEKSLLISIRRKQGNGLCHLHFWSL